jgi:hypothetical protein
MSAAVAPARRFKPVSLGIMFFTMGLALVKVGALTTLSECNKNVNNGFMYFSFFSSGICILAFILCVVKREINDFISNKIQPWAYNLSTFYLSFFMINWLLNIPNNNTCIFRFVFYLGLLWFSILLIILISSLNNNIKYVSSGIFFGFGLPLLNNENFYGFIFAWIIGFILFFVAYKNWNFIEHFPI